MVTRNAIKLINSFKEFIKTEDFDKFYEEVDGATASYAEIGEVTQLFINAGIIDEVLQKLTTIPKGMFCSTNIKKIVIPSHIISINLFAFAYCNQLKEVTISSNFKLQLEDIFGPNCRSEINFTFI